MSKFVINGAKELRGKIDVAGSKNAALPIIFSTVITHGTTVLSGVPDIGDVRVALRLLENMGAVISRVGNDLYINTDFLVYSLPDEALVSSIRASSYLLGAALSRFGRAHIQRFGGCNFDNRPIDMHLYAMSVLGAKTDGAELFAQRLVGADIYFTKKSVGATVNAIILAASAEGVSRIFGYASEPHVIALVDFLNSAGAKIILYDDYIEISGRPLHGGKAKIIPDMIEAGTYIILSLVTGASLEICGADESHLESLISQLSASGADIECEGGVIVAKGKITYPIEIVTLPYPGFPTDLQPQIAPLLAAFCGGRISERVWHSRFGYLAELQKFGVKSSVFGDTATVFPSEFHSSEAKATDLRGGAALVIAALFAQGESVIDSAEIILRGYENIVDKLRAVGADIIEIS